MVAFAQTTKGVDFVYQRPWPADNNKGQSQSQDNNVTKVADAANDNFTPQKTCDRAFARCKAYTRMRVFGGCGYNTLSQRTSIACGPAASEVASTALTFTRGGEVATIADTFNGSSLNLSYGYNHDHQRTSLTASDASYLPSGAHAVVGELHHQRAQQYASVNGTTFGYDGNGAFPVNARTTFEGAKTIFRHQKACNKTSNKASNKPKLANTTYCFYT